MAIESSIFNGLCHKTARCDMLRITAIKTAGGDKLRCRRNWEEIGETSESLLGFFILYLWGNKKLTLEMTIQISDYSIYIYIFSIMPCQVVIVVSTS